MSPEPNSFQLKPKRSLEEIYPQLKQLINNHADKKQQQQVRPVFQSRISLLEAKIQIAAHQPPKKQSITISQARQKYQEFMEKESLKNEKLKYIRQLLEQNEEIQLKHERDRIVRSRDFYSKSKNSKSQIIKTQKIVTEIEVKKKIQEDAKKAREEQAEKELKVMFKPKINLASRVIKSKFNKEEALKLMLKRNELQIKKPENSKSPSKQRNDNSKDKSRNKKALSPVLSQKQTQSRNHTSSSI